MQNEWILDILTDLRSFAETNGLPRLAAELEGVRLLAAVELAAAEGAAGNEGRARRATDYGPTNGGSAELDG